MSPTKKKTPAPKKAAPKKATAKAAAAKSAKPAKSEKPAAKKPAAKPAPAPTSKKAAAAVPATKEAARKADKERAEKGEKLPQKAATKAAAAAVPTARPAKLPEAKPAAAKTEPAGKPRPASGKKADEEPGTSTKRAKPKKLVTPSGPRHPKLGFRWACFRCDAKFYDLGKEEPLCPKCGADQRDRPADEPRAAADSARPRVVRPMAQLLDDDEPVAPLVEDDLGLDDVVESGDMFEGDGDITHLELDAAELEGETIEAGEADEF